MAVAFGEDEFLRQFPVSRETLGALRGHVDLLLKWQKRINLVSPSTVPDIWRRHVLDSAQLFSLAPPSARIWTDLGSGGGFPGLVLAAILRYEHPERQAEVHLVESDRRKAAFLRESARQMAAPVTVHAERIEEMAGWPSDVVTARACADVETLIRYARPFLHRESILLFPRGKGYAAELTAVEKCRTFRCETVPSVTDPAARIFRLKMVA
ncbi:MAG: 16S rRNA (guanine(527)-N(7))-methyltransferase RsmG [bacterium]